jgi:hypothetical protein
MRLAHSKNRWGLDFGSVRPVFWRRSRALALSAGLFVHYDTAVRQLLTWAFPAFLEF